MGPEVVGEVVGEAVGEAVGKQVTPQHQRAQLMTLSSLQHRPVP